MPSGSKRPGTILAAAIILIIIGSLSLILNICGGGQIAAAALHSDANDAGKKIGANDQGAIHRFIAKTAPGYFAVQIANSVFDAILAIGLIACGVGVLKMSALARTGAVVIVLLKLLIVFGATIYTVVFVLPAQSEVFKMMDLPQEARNMAATIASTTTACIIGFSILIHLIVAAVIFSLLYTKSARDAFAGKFAPTEDEVKEQRLSKYEGYDDDDGGGHDRPPGKETGIK